MSNYKLKANVIFKSLDYPKTILYGNDIKVLVDAASKNDLLSRTSHWLIKPMLADVPNRRLSEKVLKIPRTERAIWHRFPRFV
jgi:hypothetical protein